MQFKSNGFCGWGQLSEVGSSRPSRRRLAQPAPRPAGDIFKTTGPSPTRSVRFQSHATSARPRRLVSNLTGRLPGLAREIFIIVSLSLRAVSPPCRGFEAATCSLARAPRLLRGVARSLQSEYKSESATPLCNVKYIYNRTTGSSTQPAEHIRCIYTQQIDNKIL